MVRFFWVPSSSDEIDLLLLVLISSQSDSDRIDRAFCSLSRCDADSLGCSSQHAFSRRCVSRARRKRAAAVAATMFFAADDSCTVHRLVRVVDRRYTPGLQHEGTGRRRQRLGNMPDEECSSIGQKGAPNHFWNVDLNGNFRRFVVWRRRTMIRAQRTHLIHP